MRYDHAARVLSTLLLLAAGGCDTDEDTGELVDDSAAFDELAALDELVPHYGCWTYSSWSPIAYEGAGYEVASVDGEMQGAPVGRSQRIQLRESHEFSIQSTTTSLVGDAGASGWQWFAKCAAGDDYTSRWYPTTAEVFFGAGCADGVGATYLQVRVRAATCSCLSAPALCAQQDL